MDTHSASPAGAGFLERHRIVAALCALLVLTVIGAVLGAGVGVAISRVWATAADGFIQGG